MERKLKEATGNLKNPKDIERAQETQFKIIMQGKDAPPFKTFGPDDALRLETAPPPPPGSFKDPAEIFRKLKEAER